MCYFQISGEIRVIAKIGLLFFQAYEVLVTFAGELINIISRN